MLARLQAVSGRDWDQLLPPLLIYYRGSPHSATRFSPFFLEHGRPMRLPTTHMFRQAALHLEGRFPGYFTAMTRTLFAAYQETQKRIQAGQDRNERHFNRRKGPNPHFERGDPVWVFDPSGKIGQGARSVPYKLIRARHGPYIIEDLVGQNAAKVRRVDEFDGTGLITVNIDKLSHTHPQLAQVPVRVWNGSEVTFVNDELLLRPILQPTGHRPAVVEPETD